MSICEVAEYDVVICRPLLYTKKEDIYCYAKYYNLYHLLPTTPMWAERYKFR